MMRYVGLKYVKIGSGVGIGGVGGGGGYEFKDQPRLINFQESFELKPYIKEHNIEDTLDQEHKRWIMHCLTFFTKNTEPR